MWMTVDFEILPLGEDEAKEELLRGPAEAGR